VTLAADHTLLAAWAAGQAAGRVRRPVALLAHSLDADAEQIARWPLGRRDAALLDLLTETFGGVIEATAACHGCGEDMEVAFAVDAVRTVAGASEPTVTGTHTVRALTTDDVAAAVAGGGDADSVMRRLAARCAGLSEPLDDAGVAAVDAALDGLDPQADVRLGVTCPACDRQDELAFDVADFLWRLLAARVREVIGQVGALAQAYGWSESEVLALPRERRDLYLELVGA
jgi:hypothetical protein